MDWLRKSKLILSLLFVISIALAGCNANDQDQAPDNNTNIETDDGDIGNNGNADNELDDVQDEVDDLMDGNDNDTNR